MSHLSIRPAVIIVALGCPVVTLAQADAAKDVPAQVRMVSCDKAVARSALDELVRDPKTAKVPITLFQVASAEQMVGRKEEAAFWFLAARLRTGRQALLDKGDVPQLLEIMTMTIGPGVMPILEADPGLARRVVKRVIEWDRATPDPFRDRAEAGTGDLKETMAKLDAGLARLPDELAKDPARIAKSREAVVEADRLAQQAWATRCGPGTLDASDAEAAYRKISADAERLVKVHPLVIQQAGGAVKSAGTGAYRRAKSGLPTRLTISVQPESGKAVFAEVDVATSITDDRKLGPVKLSLACVTSLWVGQRQASWKDVCVGDPNAVRPVPATADLHQYAALAAAKYPDVPKPVCGFQDLKLPQEFVVLAAGAYSGRTVGFQIDQSGHEATRIDVSVNNPGKPVVLMLGAYEPTIWNIGWTKETKIVAALVGGYHRQAVAGLQKSTPVLVSSYENKGPCGYFYVDPSNLAPLNPLSKRVFGRPVDMVYPATKGEVLVGQAIPGGAKLVTSGEITPESLQDKSAPLAGKPGLEDAVRKGLIRKATPADADAWSESVLRNSPPRDLPPVAGQGVPKPPKPAIYNAYVVLGPFTYPAGLYGGHSAAFFIPKGVPKPQGNPGHSPVYDFNALAPRP